MRNLKFLALGAAAIITFTGCSSSDLDKFTQYKPMQNELQNAPNWVTDSVNEYQVKASAKMINDEFELARTEATMRAKAKLAERINSNITQILKEKFKKKIKNKNGDTKQNLKINTEYFVNMALIDVKEKSIWVSNKGNVWVLLEANPEVVKMAIQKVISEYSDDFSKIDDE